MKIRLRIGQTLPLLTGLLIGASTAVAGDQQVSQKQAASDSATRISNPFTFSHHGWCYAPIPFSVNPTLACTSGPYKQFFDSDMFNTDFQDYWGQKGNQGRNDLQRMKNAGANVIRLYDWNYARGNCATGGTNNPNAGTGHLPFLDACHHLNIQVIIPISNYTVCGFGWGNDGGWQSAVTNIIQSCCAEQGVIHPAVHSFGVGNEIDRPANMGQPFSPLQQMQNGLQIAEFLHQQPETANYMISFPFTTAYLPGGGTPPWGSAPWQWVLDHASAGLKTVLYNSVNSFKNATGLDNPNDGLCQYFDQQYSIPCLITELGSSSTENYAASDCPDAPAGQMTHCMVERAMDQFAAIDSYIAGKGGVNGTNIKGYMIYVFHNKEWKGGTEIGFGTFADDAGPLCYNETGIYCGGTPCGSPLTPENTPVPRLIDKSDNNGTLYSQVSTQWGGSGVRGDANRDGVVDQADIMIMLELIGSGPGDTDFNGTVNVDDVLQVINTFGTTY